MVIDEIAGHVAKNQQHQGKQRPIKQVPAKQDGIGVALTTQTAQCRNKNPCQHQRRQGSGQFDQHRGLGQRNQLAAQFIQQRTIGKHQAFQPGLRFSAKARAPSWAASSIMLTAMVWPAIW
jgi:hypothetical protein